MSSALHSGELVYFCNGGRLRLELDKPVIFIFFLMNLFVARLNYDTTESGLRSAFEAHGEVSNVKIVIDRDTDRSKGFGFVEMPMDDQARAAIAALNNSSLDGRTIVVKESEPREERPRRNFDRDDRGGYNRDRY